MDIFLCVISNPCNTIYHTYFVQFLDCVAVSDHFNNILSPTSPSSPVPHPPSPIHLSPTYISLNPHLSFFFLLFLLVLFLSTPIYPSFSPSAATLLSPSVRALVLMSDDKGGYTFYCPVRDSYSITGRLVTTLHVVFL